MSFRAPWLVSRRRKLLAIALDFFILIFIYQITFNNKFSSYPNFIVSFSVTNFWIIVSYILGRYMKIRHINLATFTNALFKTSILFLACNIIYLLINWGYSVGLFLLNERIFFTSSEKELSNFFIKSSFYFSIASLFAQYFLSLFTHNIYDNRKDWIFCGSESKFNELLAEISFNSKKLNLKRFSDDINLHDIDFSNIEGIIVNDFKKITKSNLNLIFNLKLKGLKVLSVLTWFEKEFHRIPTKIISDKYQLLDKIQSIEDTYQIRIKRVGDIIVSSFLLILLSPLFLIVSILIFIEDRGPILYFQKRSGLKNIDINVIKFRSMKIDAEKHGIQWSQRSDPRITKVGKFLRATRIDELPQLLCVIQGSMSLIGPRPERPEIEMNLLKTIPYYECRNVVRPGISGWAQVNYPYGASVSDTVNKLSFDIYYISNFSILLDLLILLKTIKVVLTGKGHKPKNTKR